MGIFDRDYHRNPPPNTHGGIPRQPSRLAGAPVVKWLLILNIAVYYVDMIIFKWSIIGLGYFSVDTAIYSGQIWRFLTFQFLHSPVTAFHLLFNMIGLFFFGHFIEKWWGSRKFIIFYLLCGVAGALFFTLLLWIPGLLPSASVGSAMVGASAGLYGILIATAIIAPNLRVLLFLVIPMSMRTVAILFLCIAAYKAIFDGDNAGGEAAHLGGAILGFALMKFPHLLNFAGKKRKGRRKVVDAKVVRESKMRPRISINLDDSEIDRILDKVNRDGLQSLTEEERDVLRRVAEQ